MEKPRRRGSRCLLENENGMEVLLRGSLKLGSEEPKKANKIEKTHEEAEETFQTFRGYRKSVSG